MFEILKHLCMVNLLQRFGNALVPSGKLNLNQQKYEKDFKPIDDQCRCSTCRNYTRAYLHMVIADGVASPLITVHNVAYQVSYSPFLLLFYL